MALVAGRWFTTVQFQETSGKKTTRRFEQSNPADDAAARAASLALVTDFAAASNAKIAAYWTHQEFIESSETLPTGAENQNEGVLLFQITPTKSGRVAIPAAADACFAAASGPNYDVIDITATEVTDLAANWLLDELYYLSDGEEAASLLGGTRRTRGAANS